MISREDNSKEDGLKGRQAQRKTNSKEHKFTGRKPQRKKILKEEKIKSASFSVLHVHNT